MHYCLRKGKGTMRWQRKKHSQLNIQLKVESILLSFEFTNILQKRKRGKVTLTVQIYITVVLIQFLYLKWLSATWSQFSNSNSRFLCLFRFQGSSGSAHCLLECLDYCHHSKSSWPISYAHLYNCSLPKIFIP